jgi:hypothetical protein
VIVGSSVDPPRPDPLLDELLEFDESPEPPRLCVRLELTVVPESDTVASPVRS